MSSPDDSRRAATPSTRPSGSHSLSCPKLQSWLLLDRRYRHLVGLEGAEGELQVTHEVALADDVPRHRQLAGLVVDHRDDLPVVLGDRHVPIQPVVVTEDRPAEDADLEVAHVGVAEDVVLEAEPQVLVVPRVLRSRVGVEERVLGGRGRVGERVTPSGVEPA